VNPEPFTLNRRLVKTHAGGSGQGCGNSSEDADDDLDDKLPDVLLGIAVGKGDGFHLGDFRVRHYVVDSLLDGFFQQFAEDFVNELFHRLIKFNCLTV